MRKKMVQAQEKKRSIKHDDKWLILSDDYMRKQIDGDDLHKLVRRWKKVPHTSRDMWKTSMLHQKDSLFAKPLVHDMCTDLQKTCTAASPQKNAGQPNRNNTMNEEQEHQEANKDQEQHEAMLEKVNDEEASDEEGLQGLNGMPEEVHAADQDAHIHAHMFDLNLVPEQEHQEANQ